ncbi:MAG TPA: TolC family protein [Terriglobales bacterium]|nr:TolC family protein [Terriglobales bacterium]
MDVFRRSMTGHWLIIALAIQCFLPAWAQQQDYSKSVPIFPNVLKPYSPRHVPEPNFANTARIDQVLKDGKMMLSLNDAIALALENNLDLVIARYNLPIADTDILRAHSGANVRGVNTGIVSGTPGGGVGSIGNAGATGGGAGGTAAAAGGAGTGTAGIVSSTLGVGPPIDSFDPLVSAALGIQHTDTPESNTVFTGVPSFQQNTGSGNFTYTQGFASGTLLTVNFNNSRVTTNSTRTFLVPQLNSNFLVQFRQHLLQGFGMAPNKRFIVIARNNREISDIAFRQQVIFTVTQIENLYWNLVSAYEDLQAKERALKLASELETNNRRQVKAGTLAAIEIVNAQAQVASSRQALIASQTNLQLQQLLMKNAITRNAADPVLAAAPVIPTDRMELPPSEEVVPIQDLINEALQRRPELAQSRVDLTNRAISKNSARNAMFPAVDFVANYGGTGLGGLQNPNFISATTPPASVSNSGFWDAVSSVADHPTYFVGFNVNIPIRNRAAQADQVRSELEYRQAQARLQQLQNAIGIDVRNAQFAVQQNRAQVEAAISGREYAYQSLVAEEKKLQFGTSTTYNVLQTMTNLATAESNLVNAMTAYEESKVQLDVVTGLTLEHLGIDMGESESGKVTHLPHVPNVVPSENATIKPIAPAPMPAPAPPQVPQTQPLPQTYPPLQPPPQAQPQDQPKPPGQ